MPKMFLIFANGSRIGTCALVNGVGKLARSNLDRLVAETIVCI